MVAVARRLSDKPLSPATQARAARRRGLVPARPPEPANLRATRHGAFIANGSSLPAYDETLADVRAVVAQECPWLGASDAFTIELFASELTTYRFAARNLGLLTGPRDAEEGQSAEGPGDAPTGLA